MTRFVDVSAYLPDGRRTPGRLGPGQLSTVPLEVVSVGPSELVLPEVTVRDERGIPLLDPTGQTELLSEPCRGGGPRATADQDFQSRVFGLTNVAVNAQRMLRTMAELLERPLPHLLIRIGMHESPRRWRGGHYRVAARSYDPPEFGHAQPTGEIHLGGGDGMIPDPDGGEPYFGAPSHNLAIVYHEIGHHVCRHTADFRLNELRPPAEQTNKKVAVDEGTCDILTAIMLDRPDIYGWHRATTPEWERRRRGLHPRWTMARFEGGSFDPHFDGTIWASGCWSARESVASAGHDHARFDRMLLHGLRLAGVLPDGARSEQERSKLALKQRRYVSTLLEAMLAADPELAEPVLAGMAVHGIHPGASNVALREAALAAKLAS